MQTTWFALLGAVWVLYLVLGGTDLGVGMLLRRTDARTALRAIGPTWAANDVWLVIAVAAMLGSFPGWYAAWASGLYLPLVVLLVALMLRHAGIELMTHATERAVERWKRVIAVSSVVLAFGWGVVWTGALDGSLARGEAGGLGVLSPRSVLVGLALVALCRLQGLAFLRLRVPAARAGLPLRRASAVTAVLVLAAGVALATGAAPGVGLGAVGAAGLALAGAGLALVVAAGAAGRAGWALLAGAAVTTGAVVAVFGALFPTPIAGAGGVTVTGAAAGNPTLSSMLWIAALLLPPLLAALAFAYVRFLRAPEGVARGGVAGAVARALRGTLHELR
nr:cytochrome d ubiquinol oxidase subunit II [Patulibacter sp. SYSU D01012]